MESSHVYRPPFTWEEVLGKFNYVQDSNEFRAELRRPEWKKTISNTAKQQEIK